MEQVNQYFVGTGRDLGRTWFRTARSRFKFGGKKVEEGADNDENYQSKTGRRSTIASNNCRYIRIGV